MGSQTSHEEQTNANHDTPRPLRPHIPESVKFGESKEIVTSPLNLESTISSLAL